jgi:hypothetical protein
LIERYRKCGRVGGIVMTKLDDHYKALKLATEVHEA